MPEPTSDARKRINDDYARKRARNARTLTWIVRCAVAAPAVLLLVLVTQCDFDSTAAKESVKADTAILQAEADVRTMLRDPASAEFNAVKAHNGVVCGMVNARNALGGMTGPRRFIVGVSTLIEPAEQDELFSAAWTRQC